MAQDIPTALMPNEELEQQVAPEAVDALGMELEPPAAPMPAEPVPVGPVSQPEPPAALQPNAPIEQEAQQFGEQITQVPAQVQTEQQPQDTLSRLMSEAQAQNDVMTMEQYQQQFNALQQYEDTLKQRIAVDKQRGLPPEGIRNKYELAIADLDDRKAQLQQASQQMQQAAAEESQPQTPEEEILMSQMQAEQQAALDAASMAQQAGAEAEALASQAEARKMGVEQARERAAAQRAEEAQLTQERVQQKVQELDEQAPMTLAQVYDKGTFLQKLGATLAVLAGGISQGMLGSKSNPAIDAINREVDRYAQRQKLRQEERESLRKQMLEDAKMRMQAVMNQSKLAMNNANLQKTLQDIELAQQDAAKKQLGAVITAEASRKQGLSPEEIMMLDKEDRDRLVPLPNSDRQVLAANKAAADKLREFTAEVVPAIDGVDRVLEIATSSEYSRLSPEERARVATEVQSLVGQLRIPLTGPGVLTDTEYARLLNTIGNPNNLLSLPSWERTKLQTVKKKLSSDIRTRYQQAGVQLPTSAREQKIAEFQKRYPGMSSRKIEQIVNKFYGE